MQPCISQSPGSSELAGCRSRRSKFSRRLKSAPSSAANRPRHGQLRRRARVRSIRDAEVRPAACTRREAAAVHDASIRENSLNLSIKHQGERCSRVAGQRQAWLATIAGTTCFIRLIRVMYRSAECAQEHIRRDRSADTEDTRSTTHTAAQRRDMSGVKTHRLTFEGMAPSTDAAVMNGPHSALGREAARC
jgi:hypothetical protein